MITIKIDWVKNRTWGMNPHAELYNSNKHYFIEKKRSGYGYDKLSAVVADVLNADDDIKERLQHKYYKNAPYGVHKDLGIDAGIGMGSVKEILKWLGYHVTHEETKTSDFIQICAKGE